VSDTNASRGRKESRSKTLSNGQNPSKYHSSTYRVSNRKLQGAGTRARVKPRSHRDRPGRAVSKVYYLQVNAEEAGTCGGRCCRMATTPEAHRQPGMSKRELQGARTRANVKQPPQWGGPGTAVPKVSRPQEKAKEEVDRGGSQLRVATPPPGLDTVRKEYHKYEEPVH
jgi:hypothetical protein